MQRVGDGRGVDHHVNHEHDYPDEHHIDDDAPAIHHDLDEFHDNHFHYDHVHHHDDSAGNDHHDHFDEHQYTDDHLHELHVDLDHPLDDLVHHPLDDLHLHDL